jgi:hypothetical protein
LPEVALYAARNGPLKLKELLPSTEGVKEELWHENKLISQTSIKANFGSIALNIGEPV